MGTFRERLSTDLVTSLVDRAAAGAGGGADISVVSLSDPVACVCYPTIGVFLLRSNLILGI